MIPEKVHTWLKENGYGERLSLKPVGGGCINNGMVIETSQGQTFFLKTNRQAPADMFAREAEGLVALSIPGGPRLPRLLLWDKDFLLLEDLAPAPRRLNYWPEFGRQLATLHSHTSPKFGFEHNNYIGSTPQLNPWTENGYEFFCEYRLLFQAGLAHKRGLLTADEIRKAENLGARLQEMLPEQPASLIHGDLWSGNAITDSRGEPAIIDPAAHFGWAEAELAMTSLFGAFPESFFNAYQEIRPLERGFRERFPIYNLYHLLNHLNLFGFGYINQVKTILDMHM